jgi:hypothetical protein
VSETETDDLAGAADADAVSAPASGETDAGSDISIADDLSAAGAGAAGQAAEEDSAADDESGEAEVAPEEASVSEEAEDDDSSDDESEDEDDEAEDEDDESPRPEPMSQMLFVDVALVLPSTHPVVILQEAEMPYRELRIPVGGAEGVAIGYAARQVATPRPLTHELISKLLDAFDLSLDAVHITSVEGANFLAELVVSGHSGVRSIDCRPSDGIALALRRQIPVPIMAAPHVLELAGGGSPSGN